ncbi:DUF559 domain-containing protein [Dyella sp. 20L07]|uniref:DUF559 domain-containing protein n=1 Tax=Dyella sp. 20L07 TaxID=3384240 RepID=UPI003D2BE80A
MIYDQRRTSELLAKGYSVPRFWNNEVLTNIDGVLEVLLEALASLGPSSQPLSLEREGSPPTET